MVELLEHAAHVATDPKRVYYFGGGVNPSRCPGAPLTSSNERLPQTTSPQTLLHMLGGLRHGLVSTTV